jgi:hypothetical protein
VSQAFKNVGDVKDILLAGLSRVRNGVALLTLHSQIQIRKSNIDFFSEKLE